MKILILGTGNMARGIGTRLLAGGHAVTLYNPDRADAEQLAQDLRGAAAGGTSVAVADTPSAAIPQSDVVILASWYSVNRQLAQELGRELAGKVVVDISNPLNATFDGLATPPGSSAAEQIRDVLPANARVVKAFNTTFAGTLVAGQVAGHTLDVFIAGTTSRRRTLWRRSRATGASTLPTSARSSAPDSSRGSASWASACSRASARTSTPPGSSSCPPRADGLP